MSGCELKEFPETLDYLISLVVLILYLYGNLKILSKTLCNLTWLVILDMSYCHNFEDYWRHRSTWLRWLCWIWVCVETRMNYQRHWKTSLHWLHWTFIKCRSWRNYWRHCKLVWKLMAICFRRLDFSFTFHCCSYLMEGSETLGNLNALVTLDFSGFDNLGELPKTLYNLISLRWKEWFIAHF